jgi:hypothetical protein
MTAVGVTVVGVTVVRVMIVGVMVPAATVEVRPGRSDAHNPLFSQARAVALGPRSAYDDPRGG